MNRVVRKIVLAALPLFSLSVYSQAQAADYDTRDVVTKVEIYFDYDSSYIVEDIPENRDALNSLSKLISAIERDSLTVLKSVEVKSFGSPEGGRTYNENLSESRASSIYEYLTTVVKIPEELIVVKSLGIDWDGLADILRRRWLPYSKEAIEIIENVPEEICERVNPDDKWLTMVDGRNSRLMALHSGVAYEHMYETLFPLLRRGTMMTLHVETLLPTEECVELVEQSVPEEVEVLPVQERAKMFAIKTNLAAYIPLIMNIGVEIPMGQHFSLDIPIYYSPYTVAQEYNFRVLMMQPEVRYWLKSALDGHFFGLHAMGGWYNLGWNETTRYQDKDGETPFYGLGLSYGYSLGLRNDRWNIEFTAGFGYARFEYDMYYNIDNGAKYDTRKIDYWGPTKLGINLVYKIKIK